MDIDLKLLQCAVMLARHHHFGRAASALGISQPTLSRRIAALENEVGFRVFERSHREVMATSAGRDMLTMADELVTRAEAMSSKLDLVRSGRAGRLRIVTGAFAAEVGVNAAVVDLIKASPTAQIELLDADWAMTLATLLADRADLAILDIGTLKRIPSLRVEMLAELSGTYVCRSGHPLLSKARLTPDDVRKYPMANPIMSHDLADLVREIDPGCTIDAGGVIPSIAVASCQLAYEIVANSDAISIAHPSQIRAGIEKGRLACLTLPWRKKAPTARFGAVYKRDRTLPPFAQTLIKLIRKRMRSL